MAARMIHSPLCLILLLAMACVACEPSAPKRGGEWLRANHESVRRDCQPILDSLDAYFAEHRRYPDESDPTFAAHADWLNSQNWNWTYFTEPDRSSFCLGIGDHDLDGISVVWCSRHGGWALDTKDQGLVKLDPLPTNP